MYKFENLTKESDEINKSLEMNKSMENISISEKRKDKITH
jgi:hypothetical protein